MDFKKNQKHPDWLTVPVSCVISEWLCHLQWTWTSYWWLLDGNLFERHSSLEILDTRTFCICKHIQTIGGRERKSKPITVSDGRVFEVTERARFPLQTPSDCFLLYFTLAGLRCALGNHNIHVGIFTQCLSGCLNCLTEKLKGLIAGIIMKAVICSNKRTANQVKRNSAKRFPPFVYMPTRESHLVALNCLKKKKNN